MSNPILTDSQIRHRITRLAWQLWEANFGAEALRLVGISGSGYRLAELLATELKAVAPDLRTHLARLTLDKAAPLTQPVTLVPGAESLVGERIVLIDDVLNTGRTLAYALAEILRLDPERVQTLLLIDRQHPRFPIAATFTGLSLATTLADHIRVELPESGEFNAFLVASSE